MQSCKIKPIDAFQTSFKWLKLTGFFMAIPKIENPTKALLHNIYRTFTLIILLLYDVQHVIFIVQEFDKIEHIIESLTVLITSLYATIQLLMLNTNSRRFEYLHDLLNDVMFSAITPIDEKLMRKNKELFQKLSKMSYSAITATGVCWIITPFLKKMSDGDVLVAAYFPFETNDWFGYSCASIWQTMVIIWVGYGHMSIDILLVGYYSQVKVQLSIIKYHLEHIADDFNDGQRNEIYLDKADADIQKKFVKLIERYKKVVRFYNEVEILMDKILLVQFFSSSATICIVAYKMTDIRFNTTFAYLALYLGCLLLELFIYCYFGTLLENESIFVNDFVYQSNWTSLSPRFRRQLLIAMTCWSRPLTPKAAGLVSINLDTFVSVLRLSYSIYTILKS